MGNRFASGIARGVMPMMNRYVGHPILSRIGRLFFRSPAEDFHCGIRRFEKTVFEQTDLCTTGMEYASEMVITATLEDMKICKVPTTRRLRSAPMVARANHTCGRGVMTGATYDSCCYCIPRWLFLYPGMILMAIELVLGARLLIALVHIGDLELGIHTLIYCAGMLSVGFQLVSFAVLASVLQPRPD